MPYKEPRFIGYDADVIVGNNSATIPNAIGALDAIVISNDGTTPGAGRIVTITATLATGLTVAFSITIGAGQDIYHPRKQAVAAALGTAVAGIYDRWHLAGKVTVAVTSGGAGDHTKVRLITEP